MIGFQIIFLLIFVEFAPNFLDTIEEIILS